MPYQHLYRPAMKICIHTRQLLPSITDPELIASYLGFSAAIATTTYEACIKYIITDFAKKLNSVFGHFIERKFNRMNAKIKIGDLRNYLENFGDKYLKEFNEKIKNEEEAFLTAKIGSTTNSYSNIILWRHTFIHTGSAPPATIDEIIASFELGKGVISCFYDSLNTP